MSINEHDVLTRPIHLSFSDRSVGSFTPKQGSYLCRHALTSRLQGSHGFSLAIIIGIGFYVNILYRAKLKLKTVVIGFIYSKPVGLG